MASLSLAPVNIFKAGADEERAETARLSSFIGAIAIGDLVKSTLGPKGMDKILLSSGRDASLMVTNDGATILKNIGVDNPAAKVLVDMSRVQDDEVGDGTTSVTVLAAELLRVRAAGNSTLVLGLWFEQSNPRLLLCACLLAGSGIFNCKKDPSTDHHCGLEGSHKGSKRGPAELSCGSWF
uniref:Chaperonin containing TCP1 subunit 2 n=1 Tax=Rattus norvegicus TaxID=10116 RepID=A0ABK0LIL5_RAT